jgi:hypothetical protein
MTFFSHAILRVLISLPDFLKKSTELKESLESSRNELTSYNRRNQKDKSLRIPQGIPWTLKESPVRNSLRIP